MSAHKATLAFHGYLADLLRLIRPLCVSVESVSAMRRVKVAITEMPVQTMESVGHWLYRHREQVKARNLKALTTSLPMFQEIFTELITKASKNNLIECWSIIDNMLQQFAIYWLAINGK